MIKNYIWDFDGMLFDTYPHIASSFVRMMSDFGQDIDYNEAKKLLEISFATAYERYDVTDEQKVVFKQYEHSFDFEPAFPFENTIETLKKVKESGCDNYIYTHRGYESLTHYLKKYEIFDLFTEIVSSKNEFPLKPCPDALNYLADNNSLDKSVSIMIGDREIDVLAGKNAGYLSCRYSKEDVETVADYLIHDISEILSI